MACMVYIFIGEKLLETIKTEPIIAIIVPVYNTESYLRECLESIRSQTLKNFLCVIVNDGSTDGSLAIAYDYATRDKRFKVYDRQNGGVSSARNFALDLLLSMKCLIKYVCFIDSDDTVSQVFLEDFVTQMNKYEADYAECGICTVFADGYKDVKPLAECGNECLDHDDIARHMFSVDRFKVPDATSFPGLCNKCVRLDRIGAVRFDKNLACCEDQKFIFELYPLLKKEVLIRRTSYYYRMRGSSATGRKEFRTDRILTDIAVYEETLVNVQNCGEIFRKGLSTMFIEYLYRTWRDSARDCPEATSMLFNALRRNFALYRNLLPKALSRKLFRVRLGYRVNNLYLKFRMKDSERRHKRKGKLCVIHEKFR